MDSHAYHDVTCSRARHVEILEVIHKWFGDHQFKSQESSSNFTLIARKGSHLGMRDRARIREMEVLVRPEFGLTIISIYHRTHRLGFIVGLMKTDILQQEVESLIDCINAIPSPE